MKLYIKNTISPIRLVAVLGLFILPMATMSCLAIKSKAKKQEPVAASQHASNSQVPPPPPPPPNVPPHQQQRPAEMVVSVAVVRPLGDDGYITVGFLRSERFYKISKEANPEFLEILKDSEKNHTSVSVTMANKESDIIIGVRKVGR